MKLEIVRLVYAVVAEKISGRRMIAMLFGAAALLSAGWATADPPVRVARLAYISGAVSFSPAGEDDWVEAVINRPLITGDRLWVDAGARAELQVGSAVFHMGGNTSVTLLNLNNRVAQLQLAQGTMNVRVRRLGAKDVVEIDTPNLAYSVRKPGGYRIDVDPDGSATTVSARSGQAEVYGEGAAYLVNAGQTYRYFGTNLSDYDDLEAARPDAFDNWSAERNRRGDNSVSARYVSRDVIGYEDLDEYGGWRSAEGYGNVWVPNRVSAGWAPYQDGHWSWVEPWGWTWIDDAPWGFAVSHYGRWANLNGTWGWVPGPVRAQPVYAPALVAFIAGGIFSATISSGNAGNVGWFPLGPRDVYRPSYPVSRAYFNNVNTSNTTVNNTTITNVYNNTNVTRVTYVNQRVPGAVVAMPANAFAQSHAVGKSRIQTSRENVATAPVAQVAAVAPIQTSVHGGAPQGRKPPEEARTRPVVAKERPPAAPVPFAAKQSALTANRGKPLDAKELAAVTPAAPAPAPAVKVVTTPAKPAAAPPPTQRVGAPGGSQPPDARRGTQSPDAEKGRAQDAQKGSRPAEAQKAPPPTVSAPPPVVNVPRPPEAQMGPSPEPTRAAQPPEVDRRRPQESQKAPRPAEAQKAPTPPPSAPPPVVNVPRPPEAQKGPSPESTRAAPPPEVDRRRPQESQKAPRPAEAQKDPTPPPSAPPPVVNVPRPPEAQKGPSPESTRAVPPPEVDRRRPQESQKGARPAEARTAPAPAVNAPPPVVVPKPPEPPKAPPPPVVVPKQPEPPKAPPPDAKKAPPPPDAQKAPAPKPDAGKSADRRSDKDKKDDEEKNRKQ